MGRAQVSFAVASRGVCFAGSPRRVTLAAGEREAFPGAPRVPPAQSEVGGSWRILVPGAGTGIAKLAAVRAVSLLFLIGCVGELGAPPDRYLRSQSTCEIDVVQDMDEEIRGGRVIDAALV